MYSCQITHLENKDLFHPQKKDGGRRVNPNDYFPLLTRIFLKYLSNYELTNLILKKHYLPYKNDLSE